jgi:hypothetical protein
MEENSLTLAILREIRDNTARTNERVDHLTERVDAQGELLQTLAAVQIRQEALLKRHDDALTGMLHELRRIHDRIDNVFEGPLAGTVRDHETRLRRLEGRDS